MLTVIVILLLLGLILIVLEAVLPGGVAGTVGTILIGVGAVVSFRHFGAGAGAVYLAIALPAAIGIGLLGFFIIAPKFSIGPPEPEDKDAEARQAALVGRRATVLKTLDPTGYVTLDGKRRSARTVAASETVEEGAEVEILELDGIYLVVVPTENDGGAAA